jgi:hypothetical protein
MPNRERSAGADPASRQSSGLRRFVKKQKISHFGASAGKLAFKQKQANI